MMRTEFRRLSEHTIDDVPDAILEQFRRACVDENGNLDPTRLFKFLSTIFTAEIQKKLPNSVIKDKKKTRDRRADQDPANFTGRFNKRGHPITITRSNGSNKTWKQRRKIANYAKENGLTYKEARKIVMRHFRTIVVVPSPAEIGRGVKEYQRRYPGAKTEEAEAVVSSKLAVKVIETNNVRVVDEIRSARARNGWRTRADRYIARHKDRTGEVIGRAEARRRMRPGTAA